MSTADVTITFYFPDFDSFPGTIPEFIDDLRTTAAPYGATTHATPGFRAGQKLTAEDMDALPAGSVLRDKIGAEMTKGTDHRWAGEDVSVADAIAFAEHWAPVLVSAPYPAVTATQEQTAAEQGPEERPSRNTLDDRLRAIVDMIDLGGTVDDLNRRNVRKTIQEAREQIATQEQTR